MKKTPLENLNLDVYHGVLDNGFRYYIVPKDNVNSFYATLSTDYGSKQIEFIPSDSRKMISVPAGIAHFLEHKMFESKDGVDPFVLFDKNGASANANTNNSKTTYLFSGTNNFLDNLKILLNYVNEPYFTDQNVEKEKGIIIQEINMCNDSFDRRGYNKILENSFVKSPIRIPVIGNKESVNSITKEDLYKCYNTFYHPSNMFLVITGNIDVESTIKVIEENQVNKKKAKKIKVKKYREPDRVKRKTETIRMNVSIPKIYIAYKINIKNIDINIKLLKKYFSIYLDALFGGVSKFDSEIKEERICNEGVGYFIISEEDHILLVVIGETKKISKLVNKIDETIGLKITEEEFERKKKTFISSLVYASDNIFGINNILMDDLITLKEVNYNIYSEIKNMNINILNNILDNINFDAKAKVIIKPQK